MNFLTFSSPENECLCFTYIYKGYFFAWYRILDWLLFFQQFKKVVSLTASMVSGVEFSHFNNHPPIGNMLFFSGCFQVFSLSLVFRNLIVTCLGMDFFELILLGFTGLLESVGLWPLPNLKIFSHYYFQCHILSPLLLRLQWHEC